jgi:hypothetical protein
VACAVARARDRTGDFPTVREMALYHGATGALTTGAFLDQRPCATVRLDAEQLARRRAMIACYASQRATLAPFTEIALERTRVAPRYDFARPPHSGPLWYERLGFPISGALWRALAAGA